MELRNQEEQCHEVSSCGRDIEVIDGVLSEFGELGVEFSLGIAALAPEWGHFLQGNFVRCCIMLEEGRKCSGQTQQQLCNLEINDNKYPAFRNSTRNPAVLLLLVSSKKEKG